MCPRFLSALVAVLLLVVASVSCGEGGSESEADASLSVAEDAALPVPDAGEEAPDAEALAPRDAADLPDAELADASSAAGPDAAAEAPDAGVADGSLPDAAAADPDAGVADGSLPDAAAAGPDAGDLPADAGSPDAGAGGFDGGLCTANGLPGTCLDVADCVGTRDPVPGHCPGPASIQCCTPRYAVDCDSNLRPQPNAGLVEEAGEGGCPAGMLRVSTFCIDRFEAALEELLPDGSAVPWSPYFNPAGRRIRALSLRGAVPQGYVNQTQAAAACAEAGKRLCTDAEWLRACRGPSSTTYPYGNVRQNGVCNDHRASHPAVELYGTSASWIFSHIDSPCLNQLEDGLARTAEYAGCLSAEGVADLMGNLHEWTADPAGTFRGGFYVDTVLNGEGCLYRTTAHAVSHWDYSTGFRCCRD